MDPGVHMAYHPGPRASHTSVLHHRASQRFLCPKAPGLPSGRGTLSKPPPSYLLGALADPPKYPRAERVMRLLLWLQRLERVFAAHDPRSLDRGKKLGPAGDAAWV